MPLIAFTVNRAHSDGVRASAIHAGMLQYAMHANTTPHSTPILTGRSRHQVRRALRISLIATWIRGGGEDGG